MEKKYVVDYMEELAEYFPQIPEEELEKIMLDLTKRLTLYMRKGVRGFATSSNTSLDGSNKMHKFQVDRVYNYTNLRYLRVKNKIRREIKLKKAKLQDGEE